MASTVPKQLKIAVSGLDCPNCAAKLEGAIQRMPEVHAASLDFASGLLHLTAAGEEATIFRSVQAVASQVEPEVNLAWPKNGIESPAEASRETVITSAWIRLAVGSLFYVGALTWPAAPLWAYLPAYAILGIHTIYRAIRNLGRKQLFDENFLMTVATLGAFAIGEYPEAVAVMLFYELGEFFQDLAVNQSRRSIKTLIDLRPDYANLLESDNTIKRVIPEDIAPGMRIVVKPGERVPLDGRVLEGSSLVDTAALTGESVPRQVHTSDEILAGCVNKTALLTVEVTKPYGESAIARMMDLVESAGARKAPTERFITRFARYYTPAVVFGAIALAVLPPLFSGGAWQPWVYRALVFLVVSCPCALMVSVPLGFFGGIGGAARQGVLVKGANYLESLGRIKTVVFDKTGTLTQGVFRVVAISPVNGIEPTELLSLAAAAERYSLHPVAESIRQSVPADTALPDVANYQEVAGEGVLCQVAGQSVGVGNQRLLQHLGVTVPETTGELATGTVVHVAKGGEYQGSICVADALKEDAREAIRKLRAIGVRRIAMLTGDREPVAAAVAAILGLDEVHAELLPHEKVAALERILDRGDKLAFVGDGINDAPVLARADVGVAMGALGSDAAIEAADVVLMTDEPTRLVTAIKVARRTKKIVMQNVGLAFGVKALVLALGGAGLASMWEAVFADVGVALLAVLNSLRVMRVSV